MPRESVALDPRTCLQCGLIDRHRDVLKDCVPALRDRIAALEFRKSVEAPKPILRSREGAVRLPVGRE